MHRFCRAGAAAVLGCLGLVPAHAQQQYPLMDRLADRVVQKYQDASCPQLAAQRAKPPAGQRAQMEARMVEMLHRDPQLRQAFIDRVSAPIANKMFECGFIP